MKTTTLKAFDLKGDTARDRRSCRRRSKGLGDGPTTSIPSLGSPNSYKGHILHQLLACWPKTDAMAAFSLLFENREETLFAGCASCSNNGYDLNKASSKAHVSDSAFGVLIAGLSIANSVAYLPHLPSPRRKPCGPRHEELPVHERIGQRRPPGQDVRHHLGRGPGRPSGGGSQRQSGMRYVEGEEKGDLEVEKG
uniref:Uncharacterized protein n=1 Tax=Steinernema glaseri TaxID=37863 RepID=A0A1I7Y5V9_9BILA